MSELQWGPATSGWRLSASLDRDAFKVDEAIHVAVVFENVAGQEQPYGAKGKDFDYDLDCRDPQGRRMPLSQYGQRMMDNREEGRYILHQLPPGGKLVNDILLSRNVDMTLPGKYTLTVRREVFPHDGRKEPPVVSNSCTFEIKE